MAVHINPDLGDAITIEDQGVNWRVSYWFVDPDFNEGEKTFFEASFPADFNELHPDDVEQAMLELAMATARGQNIHS